MRELMGLRFAGFVKKLQGLCSTRGVNLVMFNITGQKVSAIYVVVVTFATITGQKVSAHRSHRKGLLKLSCHFDP